MNKKTLFILLFLLLNIIFAANSIDDFEKQIREHRNMSDSLQNLIMQSEEKISQLAKQETEQLSQLNEMETKIETSKALIESTQKQIDSLSAQKKITQNKLEETLFLLNKRKEIMVERLRNIYKIGEPSVVSVILGASSPEELVNRIRYMQDLNRYDRNLLDTIRSYEQKLQNENEILLAENDALEILLKEQQAERENVLKQADERKKFLDDLRSEKGKYETSMVEYKNAQEELNAMIEQLIVEMSKPKESKRKSDFANKKGNLPWAVSGKVIAEFGKITHPEYKTTIMNNGIDIEAAIGTPVKSVADGVVEFVGRMRGYGKLMIVNHFGGYLTIYAHLDENFYEAGAEVSEGQNIGSVGESGSLDGSKLHFEIRSENNALNPVDWLEKRR